MSAPAPICSCPGASEGVIGCDLFCFLCLRFGRCCLVISPSDNEIEELASTPTRPAPEAYAWLALGCPNSLAETEASECCDASVIIFSMTMADLVSAVLHLGVRSLLCEANLGENVFQEALDLSGGVLVVTEAPDEECEGCLRRVSH